MFNPMLEEALFHLLAELERFGLPLSIAAWLSVAVGVLAMGYALRNERRGRVWRAGPV